MERISRAVRAVGAPFSVRGVEAEVIGKLSGPKDAPVLEIERTGETVRLAPLTAKVQWDLTGKRLAPASRSERRAFDRLIRGWDGSPKLVRIVGPLRAPQSAASPRLEVRWYRNAE